MPEFKYTGAPTLTPEEARRTAAIPEIRETYPEVTLTRAPSKAMEAVGQGIEHLGNHMNTFGAAVRSLGNSFEHAGNELYSRASALKQLEAETNANNAGIDWTMKQIKRDEKFQTLKGLGASSDALGAFMKESEDERQAIKAKLGSDLERKMYDAQTTHTFVVSARVAGKHSAQETKQQSINSDNAQLDILYGQYSKATEQVDADEIQRKAFGIYSNQLRWKMGMSDEDVKHVQDQWLAKGILARAKILSETDAPMAMKMLEDNAERLRDFDPSAYHAVFERIKAKSDSDGANVIADRSNADPRMALDQVLGIAREQAEKERPGDRLFAKKAEDAAKREWATNAQEQEINNARNYESAQKAVHANVPGQDRPPRTETEYMALEGQKAIYEQLKQHQQDQIKSVWEANARGIVKPTDETRRTTKRWQLEMQGDFNAVAERLEQDPSFFDKLPIPEGDRQHLWNTYLSMRARGISDQDTLGGRIYNYLHGAGLDPKLTSESARRLYKGFLEEEARELKKEHPLKPLTHEEYERINTNAKAQMGGWFGFGATPAYRAFQVPTSGFIREYRANVNPDATAEEIQREYLRVQIRKQLKEQEKRPVSKSKTIPGSVAP